MGEATSISVAGNSEVDEQIVHLRKDREVEKHAPMAECREEAEDEVPRKLFFGDDGERDSMTEVVRKRQPHVPKALNALQGAPTFTSDRKTERKTLSKGSETERKEK